MYLRLASLAFACAAVCFPDTLTLRSGQIVQGTYTGGTSRTVKMQVDDAVKTFDITDIAKIEFTAPSPAASAATRPAPQPPAPAARP